LLDQTNSGTLAISKRAAGVELAVFQLLPLQSTNQKGGTKQRGSKKIVLTLEQAVLIPEHHYYDE